MDDVLGKIVVAIGDVDLLPTHPIGSIPLRHRARAHLRQVGARLWLGQVHRASPAAIEQARHVEVFLFVGAGGQQCLDGTVRQQRTQRKRQIGRLQHFHACGGHHLWQSLAAVLLRMLDALPTRLRKSIECRFEAGRRDDFAVVPVRRLDVAGPVQRRHHLGAEASALFKHGSDRLVGRILVAGQGLHVGQGCDLAHREQHVLDGRHITHVHPQK